MPNNNPALGLTELQAAKFLGVSPVTLKRWRDMDAISHRILPGGGIRYAQEHLDEFVKSTEVEAKLGKMLR